MSSTSHGVEVLRPPSPHLGNFNQVFDDFLKRASGTEPRIDISALIARLDSIGYLDVDRPNKQRKKLHDFGVDGSNDAARKTEGCINEASPARTVPRLAGRGNPRNLSHCPTKVAEAVLCSALREFIPAPLQDAVEDAAAFTGSPTPSNGHGISHSSPETTDTVVHQQSVFDQTPWQYASEVTPLTSPDTATIARPAQSTPTRKRHHISQGSGIFSGLSQTPTTTTYDYSAVGLSGFQAGRYHAASIGGVQSSLLYSTNASSFYTHGSSVPVGVSGSSGPMASDVTSDMGISPNGLFQYHRSMIQPVPGAELYLVEAAKSGVDRITPHYMCTKDDKVRVLEHKLQKLMSLDRLTEATIPAATKSVHVFVDLSNITIGFYDCLKASHNIPTTRRMKAPRFSFEHLALILERGRSVEKRVVAGSLDSTYARKWPAFMQEAKELDYEMCIMQRVAKAMMPTTKNKRLSAALEPEWTASDANSSSEEAFIGQLRQGEQGVDEVLHLKMLQSVVDDRPGTAVLATGDAAEAEFSDGFKKNVERLLNKGWNVEIIGWSKGISKAWREPEFVAQYGSRVRVIELDPFVEEMFGVWFSAPGY